MTIQPVQFPLNIGTATELRIIVLEHTETENSIKVHYHLVDTTKDTLMLNGPSLPYRVMHGNTILLAGQDYLNYKADENSVETLVINRLGVVPTPVTPAAE